MQGHIIWQHGDNRCSCSRGFSGTSLEVLGHALPLSTRSLADTVAADPNVTPEALAPYEETAQRAARYASGDFS